METRLAHLLHTRRASAEEALALADTLPTVSPEAMIGRWRGFEICTGHPIEGLLEPTGWYGKLFLSAEDVHPLLFYTRRRTALYAVDPRWIPLHLPLPRSAALGGLMQVLRPLLQTTHTRARLRTVAWRGRMTATMCYDEKAIFDHFLRIDDRTVMGIMDLKGVAAPYIFILERDDDTPFQQLF